MDDCIQVICRELEVDEAGFCNSHDIDQLKSRLQQNDMDRLQEVFIQLKDKSESDKVFIWDLLDALVPTMEHYRGSEATATNRQVLAKFLARHNRHRESREAWIKSEQEKTNVLKLRSCTFLPSTTKNIHYDVSPRYLDRKALPESNCSASDQPHQRLGPVAHSAPNLNTRPLIHMCDWVKKRLDLGESFYESHRDLMYAIRSEVYNSGVLGKPKSRSLLDP